MFSFVSGFLAPFRGFARLVARPGLWPWASVPIVLNVLITAGVAWLWFAVAEPRIEQFAPSGEGFFAGAAHWVVRALMILAALPVALVVWIACANVVGGPFYAALCGAVEAQELGRDAARPPEMRFAKSLVVGLRCEAGNAAVSLAGSITGLIVAASFPPFGVVLATGLAWFLAGFPFIAYPFDRRAQPVSRKLEVAFKHLGATLGFGLAVWVLTFPIVTLPFVAPCAVIGATLLFPGGDRAGAAA